MDKMELRINYNKAIQRLKKADEYFNNPNISLEEKCSEKIIQAYNDLIKDISILQNDYKRLYGEEMANNIKFNGFN